MRGVTVCDTLHRTPSVRLDQKMMECVGHAVCMMKYEMRASFLYQKIFFKGALYLKWMPDKYEWTAKRCS